MGRPGKRGSAEKGGRVQQSSLSQGAAAEKKKRKRRKRDHKGKRNVKKRLISWVIE